MPTISEAEKQSRLQAIESVIGTHAMEGIEVDSGVLSLMHRFAAGEISVEQFSEGTDKRAEAVLAKQRQLVGAA